MFYLKYFVLPHNELEILSQTPNYIGIMTIILQKIPSGSIGHPKQYFTFKLILQMEISTSKIYHHNIYNSFPQLGRFVLKSIYKCKTSYTLKIKPPTIQIPFTSLYGRIVYKMYNTSILFLSKRVSHYSKKYKNLSINFVVVVSRQTLFTAHHCKHLNQVLPIIYCSNIS